MSRKLLKILAICIFVTLIPVAIVGIAMAATLSAPFTVTVQLKGEVESLSEYNKSLTLTVNNNQKNSLSVGVKSDDKVTISFEGEAYDVKGFYEGGATAVNEESKPLASKVSSYTFNVNGDRTISVWIEPKTFNITFEGNETASVLTYGDELSIIEDDSEFRGWTIKTAPAGVTINDTVYNYATFPVSGDYTLSPSYAKYMEFHYFVRDEEVAVEKVEKSNDTKIELEEPKQTTIEVDKKEQIEVKTKKDGYDRYSVMVNGKNTPLCVDIQQGNGTEDWIKLEKYEDGYLLKINTGNNFIGENFNTQTSKAASNAIAIVLATSMLKAQNSGLKLSEAMLLLNSMNEIMGKPKDGDQ